MTNLARGMAYVPILQMYSNCQVHSADWCEVCIVALYMMSQVPMTENTALLF